MTSHFNQASVSDSRRQHLMQKSPTNQQMRLFGGPYTSDEARTLSIFAGKLKKSGMPESRLHRLGEAPFKGKVDSSIEVITLLGRCLNTTQRHMVIDALNHFKCTSVIPWAINTTEAYTILVDLIKITGLTTKDQQNAS